MTVSTNARGHWIAVLLALGAWPGVATASTVVAAPPESAPDREPPPAAAELAEPAEPTEPDEPDEPPPAEPDPLPPLGADGDLESLLGTSVVETASRTAEDESTAPATMTVVTADELRAYGITSIDEVVSFFGLGMSYQRDGGADGTTTMTARGVAVPGDGGNHVLVLVNGHKNNDSWGGWAYIDEKMALPLELIDRVEIINGPGAVMYGTSAMYGVINVVTKDAAHYRGVHAVVQGRLGFPGGRSNYVTLPDQNHRLGLGGRVSLGVAHPFTVADRDGEVVVQLEYLEHHRPTHVFGPQDPDWEPGPNARPDGRWGGTGAPWTRATGGFVGLRLGHWALDLRAVWWNRHHLEDYQSDFDDRGNAETSSEYRADLRHTAYPKPGVELRTRAFGDVVPWGGSWIYSDPSWCPNLPGRCRSHQQDVASIYGVEEVVTWDWFVNGKYTTLFGADVRGRTVVDAIDIVDYDTGQSAGIDGFADYDITTVAGSLFVQQVLRPRPVVGLNLGARLDVDQLFGLHVSPRAAAMVHPYERGTLKLIYSEAFRAPVAGELNFADPTYHLEAQDLDAEVVRSVELSFEHLLPRGLGRLRAGAFTSWWNNLVGERPLTDEEFAGAIADGKLIPDADPDTAVTFANFGRIFAAGGFFAMDAQSANDLFHFGTNVSLTESWRSEDGERLDVGRVPDWIVNARMSLVPGGYRPTLGVAAYYNSPRRTPEDIDGDFVRGNRTDNLIHGRLTVSGDIPRTAGLKYRAYVDYSAGRYGPYVRGQLNYSDSPRFGGELTPLDRLYLFAGLRWDFDFVGHREQTGRR